MVMPIKVCYTRWYIYDPSTWDSCLKLQVSVYLDSRMNTTSLLSMANLQLMFFLNFDRELLLKRPPYCATFIEAEPSSQLSNHKYKRQNRTSLTLVDMAMTLFLYCVNRCKFRHLLPTNPLKKTIERATFCALQVDQTASCHSPVSRLSQPHMMHSRPWST